MHEEFESGEGTCAREGRAQEGDVRDGGGVCEEGRGGQWLRRWGGDVREGGGVREEGTWEAVSMTCRGRARGRRWR